MSELYRPRSCLREGDRVRITGGTAYYWLVGRYATVMERRPRPDECVKVKLDTGEIHWIFCRFLRKLPPSKIPQ